MHRTLVTLILSLICAVWDSVSAQFSPSVVCIPGVCVEGLTNISTGVAIAAPGFSTDLLLLPGEYASNTNPQLLHDIISSSSASMRATAGFGVSSTPASVSLPLNVALQPGLSTYTQSFYSGQPIFFPLSSSNGSNNSAILFSAGSILISSDIFAVVTSNSSNKFVLWDSVFDLLQFPASSYSGQLTLVDMQSTTCSAPCSGASTCNSNGACECPQGFTGDSCEACLPDFFGPSCQSCPASCSTCDDGISGSGRCLSIEVSDAPSSCNCLNGQCASNGQCNCNAGWTASTNGTQCAQCSTGFFLTSDGDCQVCQLGCTQCADQSGDCIACQSGFTQDANDRTQCVAPQSSTSTGTICPDGSFSNGSDCTPCSPLCQTCTGSTSNDCIICGAGQFSLNGSCVSTNNNGVCEDSTMIANNNKHKCDSCPAKCTSCEIPNFNVASTINQLQCTTCLPGYVLSQGGCVESCPAGTFLSPKDNQTCTACDSSCVSCFGSPGFCLTCSNNSLASNGQCVSSCPAGTFASSGSCINCHPDCATCSGASFNQCTSCHAPRPVLSNGRCLQTCDKSQFFDTTSSSCQSCDSSCSSCSSAGPNACLACSSTNEILKQGTCTSSDCSSSSFAPGLGICLSDLVSVPQATGTSSASSIPIISGLSSPVINVQSTQSSLVWWQVLLMALGCASIFIIILLIWRRRARKRRAQRTAAFAREKRLYRQDWRWKLVRFGERLFGHKSIPQVENENEMDQLSRMRQAEEACHGFSLGGKSRQCQDVPSLDRVDYFNRFDGNPNRLSASSLFSQVTGASRTFSDPRQPVKDNPVLASRFSMSTSEPSVYSSQRVLERITTSKHEKAPSPAQEYVKSIIENSTAKKISDYVHPMYTGSSRNPFRP